MNVNNGSLQNSYKFTDQEQDQESGLYYYDARSYDANLGKFIQVDPLAFYLVNGEELKEKTGKELDDILSDPRYLNAYAYAANNPIIMVDENGEFYGKFGQDMASGQRTISSFLHQAANYTSNQGGFINKVSGFVTNAIADTVDNVANVFDPDQNAGTRIVALGLTALDAASGGEGKAAGKVVTNLGKVTKEMKVLDVAKRPIKTLKDIKGYTEHGLKEMKKYGLANVHVKDAVENTVKFTKRVDEIGRTSYRYMSEKAVVNFNKFKEFITGWPKSK